jgi:hypothetical protein
MVSAAVTIYISQTGIAVRTMPSLETEENSPAFELVPPRAFLRKAPPEARVIAIIGGGFTGKMTLANLLRQAQRTVKPLHCVFKGRCG